MRLRKILKEEFRQTYTPSKTLFVRVCTQPLSAQAKLHFQIDRNRNLGGGGGVDHLTAMQWRLGGSPLWNSNRVLVGWRRLEQPRFKDHLVEVRSPLDATQFTIDGFLQDCCCSVEIQYTDCDCLLLLAVIPPLTLGFSVNGRTDELTVNERTHAKSETWNRNSKSVTSQSTYPSVYSTGPRPQLRQAFVLSWGRKNWETNGPNPVDTVQNYTGKRDFAMMVKKHIFTINTRSYFYPISTIKSLTTMQSSQVLGKAWLPSR
jgi:hypothetical protein